MISPSIPQLGPKKRRHINIVLHLKIIIDSFCSLVDALEIVVDLCRSISTNLGITVLEYTALQVHNINAAYKMMF